jgi:hypothetical protein
MTRRLCCACAALCVLLFAIPAFAKDVVKIARIAGEVEVRHDDENDGDWTAAEEGQKLKDGWELRTGKESKVQLVFPKDNVVILKEQSFVRILEMQKGGGAVLESDKPGGLLVQLKNKLDSGATFTLRTPSAQAIVRGTEYGAQITETGETDENGDPVYETEFYGYQGEVEVTNEFGTQLLHADETIRAIAGMIPGAAIPSLPGVAGEFLDILTSPDIFEAAKDKVENEVEDEVRDHFNIPGGFPF